ncbi:MAG: hypothetical protein V1857_06185, partial [archaeon]
TSKHRCVLTEGVGRLRWLVLAFLIIEFASKKIDLLKLRCEILKAIQHRNITVDASLPPEEVGILMDIEQTPLFRYRWRLELLSEIDEPILEALRKDFPNKEVHDIRLEGKA